MHVSVQKKSQEAHVAGWLRGRRLRYRQPCDFQSKDDGKQRMMCFDLHF